MAKKAQNGNLTVLGEETVFEGELEFTDSLVITGKFDGKIKSTGFLDIAKTAVCSVESISASEISVSGEVTGKLNADKKIEMCSGSIINGDISTKKLRIADNVDFKGKITMFDDDANVDIFNMSNSEYKKAAITETDDDE